ncbi:hypothetical protein ACI2IX_20130 [Leifsonia aquatica]|uniref:hypothetical protein n=1 Tax=Leifsonia aquatica TaxID=144185 RepID=UPI00384C5965
MKELLPKRGEPIELVRYFLAGDHWASEIITGRFISATASLIRVDQEQELRTLERSQWKVCIGASAAAPRRAPEPEPRLCAAVRTQTKDDPLVEDVRVVDRRGRRREGTRICNACGARVKVSQMMRGGQAASAWRYAPHPFPAGMEVAA